jgi:LacI family transcriptional regulator
MKSKIIGLMKKLNYRPDVLCRCSAQGAPAGSKQYRIGIISRHKDSKQFDAFFTNMIRGITIQAQRNGYQIIFEIVSDSGDTLPACVQEENVDGILALWSNNATFNTACAKKVPTVFVDQNPPAYGDTILPDYHRAGTLIAEILLKNKHQKMALLFGADEPKDFTADLLKKSILDTIGAVSLTIPDNWISKYGGGNHGAYKTVKRLLRPDAEDKPTALIGIDTGMPGAYKAAVESGYNVGRDISFISCGNLPDTEYLMPGLTTVDVDPYNVGKRSVFLLVDRLNKKLTEERQVIYLPVELVERESVVHL